MHMFTRRRLLGSSAALAVGLGVGRAFAQSDKSGTLKLQAFGGEAELKSITNAIARFNKDYPNVKVEISIDPITNGWGDYVTKVLGQFNAGSAADVYGTAIETFQAFAARGLFIPLDDYVEGAQRLLGLRAEPVRTVQLQGEASTTSRSAGTTS